MSDEQEDGQSKLVTTWADVEQVIKVHAFPKWAGYALVLAVAGVLALSVLVGLGYLANRHTTQQLQVQNAQLHQVIREVKAGAITNCEAGNRARATNRLIWDEFLTLAVNNPAAPKIRKALEYQVAHVGLPGDRVKAFDLIINSLYGKHPASIHIVQNFEKYIAAHEYPVNCAKAYSRQ